MIVKICCIIAEMEIKGKMKKDYKIYCMNSYKYSNNAQYRQALRDYFQMNTEPQKNKILSEYQEIDDETMDEWLFDSECVEDKMNLLYKKTQHISAFRELYLLAAAKMISLNPEIGIAVLFSYDYFEYFHRLLHLWEKEYQHQERPQNIESTEEYQLLFNKVK